MQGNVRHRVLLAIDGDTDMKMSSVHQSRSCPHPVSQSVATCVGFTATVGMCYRPKIILYELQTQAAL